MYQADPKSIDQTLQPYSWYKSLVIEGGKARGLPDWYLDKIISLESMKDSNKDNINQAQAAILKP